MNDKLFKTTIALALAALLLAFLATGYHNGYRASEEGWIRWAVENQWAHYDERSGEVILHDLEYQDEVLQKLFNDEELFNLPDVLPEWGKPENKDLST